MNLWRLIRPAQYLHRGMYAVGLGPLVGRIVLLLTTTGRKTGKPRVTPVQYEEIDGVYYLGAARGLKTDWVRNIQVNPQVAVRVKNRRFSAHAAVLNDPQMIADFLQVRLLRHPQMIGAMMKMHHLPPNPGRAQLVELANTLAVVAIHPNAN
jgi:deazaflavin-dependent oxidoreductase (nitroreductase family)